MLEIIEDAGEELKRAEHLIYVSLKYTRTGDVLLNSLNRMIDAYSLLVDALILYAKDTKNLQEDPQTPLAKVNIVKKLYGRQEIQDNLDLYLLLRKITRSPYQTEQEYRRNVALLTTIEGREETINIDILTQYFEFQREFFKFVVTMLGEYAKKKYKDEMDAGWEKV
ncbi:MAG: hypothetical protein PHU51_00140 [Candidatus Nanoarchaeia archaeon]|nr:hypothetical protein [Candidatus Nanoarchaeia archaeon]